MFEHEEEGVEGDAVSLRREVDDSLFFFLEIVGEQSLEVLRARGQYYLVTVNGSAVKDQSDI